jgi:hypothetical protein
LPELVLGSHHLSNVKLPAIDLSPIGKACGSPIDGILGVDLLDKMGVTIDLKHQVASLATSPADTKLLFDLMETHICITVATAFAQGNAAVLPDCFDPDIVLYTPHGEFRGGTQVMEYLSQRYLKYAVNLCYKMRLHVVKTHGDAL